MSGLVCMSNHICHILRMYCVQYVEEVLAAREPILWILVLHVLHYLSILLEVAEDVLDTELIILRHSHKPAFLHFEQLLISFQDLTEEVAVTSSRWWDIELDY